MDGLNDAVRCGYHASVRLLGGTGLMSIMTVLIAPDAFLNTAGTARFALGLRASKRVRPAFHEIYRMLRWNRFCVSFYGWHKADKFLAAWREVGFRVIGHLTFIKRYASTERFLRYQHENAYLLAKGNPQKPARTIPDVLEWQYTGNNLHPTQKPVSVLTPLVESFSNPGDVVLDPFCVSGSTLLAARKLNRRFLGIELSKQYFDLAEQRLR